MQKAALDDPDDVAKAAEDLYARRDSGLSAAECHRQVHDLVRTSAMSLARTHRWEDVVQLLLNVPLISIDHDLLRVRSAAILYEQRRVTRVRRRFVRALFGVLVYLLCVAPTLFVRLDNPYRIAHGMSELDWSEGFYWSVLTLTTVGYGDIVPQTPYARMFALFNAVLGVTLMGVIAGLVLSAMTPRRIP
jgi:hypothetical protein